MMLMDRNLEIYNTYPVRYFIQCRYSSVLVGRAKFSMAVYTQGTTIFLKKKFILMIIRVKWATHSLK